MNKFFYIADGKMLVLTPRLEAYIPTNYFDGKYAYEDGEFIVLLGIFNFRAFTTDDKPGELQTFAVPALVRTKPSVVRKEQMSVNGDMEEYTILEYVKDDIMLNSTAIIKSIDNVELFFDMLISGKIPRTVPYSRIATLIDKATSLNGTNLEVPNKIYEIMAAEICRDASNMSRPFRFTAAKGNFSERGYKPANLRAIARLSSTFTGITFEDFDAMSIAAINRARTPQQHETISPIEAIIKY